MKKLALMGVIGLASTASMVHAVDLTGDITTSMTLNSASVYNLVGRVRVLDGVTLTIPAGTVVATVTDPLNQGLLAITRGGKLIIQGTKENPVIFTSANDRATWTAGDPKTGTWRAAANEWGSIALMGKAYISNTKTVATNSTFPSGTNDSPMEGLGDTANPLHRYGGDEDNDDSGSISYLSIRYGGRVLALADELNGISLGGVGRNTDIDHIEVMNNIDDGIEVFGGTVNIRYWSIWNVGDDSFDVDQGWRGKSQFGLVVQGYSVVANSGSGFPDNGFELDGAEIASNQPVTAATMYNMTFIGQPESIAASTADHATEWRDNANVQFRNCVFMDTGEKLIQGSNGASDGEGSLGYGHLGTLNWDVRWTTPYTHNHNPANPNTGGFSQAQLEQLYQGQKDGNLIEIKDSVFFNNTDTDAYVESNLRGVTVGGDDAPLMDNVVAAASPIVSVARSGVSTVNGQARSIQNVVSLDPRANNDATTSAGAAPADGFCVPAHFRGAFSPNCNWLLGWTASDAFGFHAGQTNPPNPDADMELTATTCFQSEIGCTYVVECSLDGTTWTPLAVVEGDGTLKFFTDLDNKPLVASKVYRVTIQ